MKTSSLSVFSIVAAALIPFQAPAAVQQMIIQNSPAYEAAADPLRNSPKQDYEFDQAVIADVLRLLAHDANVSFFALPQDADGADRLVTFRISASPFAALETLSKANGVALIYDNGIWYMRPANDKELIGRTYEVKHNALEKITQEGALGGASNTGGGGNSQDGGLGGGISLQGNPESFTIEPSELIDDIRDLLDLPTTGFSATVIPSFGIDPMSLGQQLPTALSQSANASSGDSSDGGTKAKVIWSSDSNTLYVVATRQQHMWIEGYLASVDKPQSLIALEVKFFESTRDPREEFGLDWTGTFGGGYNVNLAGSAPLGTNEGVGGGNDDGGDGGLGGGTISAPISGPIDLDRPGDYRLPTAILSYDAVNVRIRALLEDQQINAVSYPRMVTLNNREVLLRSVVNQPVLSSSASSSLGSGATTTSNVAYLPIGTVLNILPKRMADDKILLNISITISNIIGEEFIDGNPFPIATSRVYSAPVLVESGYTVAIGGLDEAIESRKEQGLPVISKLPLIGYLGKFKDHARNRKHLMFFITPSLIDGQHGGIPDEPQAVVRRTPFDPARPTIQPDGSLVATTDTLASTIESLTKEIDELEQTVTEGRSSREHRERISVLYAASETTIQKLAYNIQQDPQGWQELHEFQWQFSRQSERLGRIRRQLDGKRIGYDANTLPPFIR